MASKVGLGVPLPLLAPATATWAAPFALYYVFLQNRIVFHRVRSNNFTSNTTDPEKGNNDPLYVANRAQVNFAENVPLVLAVALLAELNGASRSYINWALGALFAFRVGHAEFGLMLKDSAGVGRPIGYFGTQAVLVGLSSYAAYLIKDYWMI
ncbi:hypothetical protein IAQ61_010289 [Plenodomus lingam]|nr:hypothetical protein IAQ61_010289 [Plenodomus lingam]